MGFVFTVMILSIVKGIFGSILTLILKKIVLVILIDMNLNDVKQI